MTESSRARRPDSLKVPMSVWRWVVPTNQNPARTSVFVLLLTIASVCIGTAAALVPALALTALLLVAVGILMSRSEGRLGVLMTLGYVSLQSESVSFKLLFVGVNLMCLLAAVVRLPSAMARQANFRAFIPVVWASFAIVVM